MHLSDYDLQQLDEEALGGLSEAAARALLLKILEDLIEARDRLNRNARNSSMPPSRQTPWEKPPIEGETATADEDVSSASQPEADDTTDQLEAAESEPKGPAGEPTSEPATQKPGGSASPLQASTEKRNPGKQPGALGVGRTQKLPISAEQTHAPDHCTICGVPLDESVPSRPYTGRYEIDLQAPDSGMSGIVLTNTKHIYLECECPDCGHWNRAQPGRAEAQEEWAVELTEWHLAGPMLVSFIVFLTTRMRLSRASTQELLSVWLGLDLSVGVINQCVHEAGRAVEPVVQEQIIPAVRAAEVVHADETSWSEHGALKWLWVFTCATASFFFVGSRQYWIVAHILGSMFDNWLMSDGYGAYRDFDRRLRCLTHIVRKAKGLVESLDRRAQGFGQEVLDLLYAIMESVQQARDGPPNAPLRQLYEQKLAELFKSCVFHATCGHGKTQELARELLNDWDTFWVVLDHPELPLTNNEAERALRHWVIARLISHGTRTSQGSRVFAYLASVIDTCRKRATNPWIYLAEVIKQRRKELPAPALPVLAA